MSDRPVFRERERPVDRRRELGMVLLLVMVGTLLFTRPWWASRAPQGDIVEVVGSVPRPGTFALDKPTLAKAVAAAGGDASSLPNTPLAEGDRVVVSEDGVHVTPMSDPLAIGLPVDINQAGVQALTALPGIGPETAARIIEEREQGGTFDSVDELTRVHGIGPATVSSLRPYLTASSGAP